MLSYLNGVLSGVIVPALMCASGLFYCIKLRFFHIFKPHRVLRALRPDRRGSGFSSIGALLLALAGTLGVGNIVGVCSAISLGGFGAVFWMWISALLAMILKYAEIVLTMIYRKRGSDGSYRGCATDYVGAFWSSLGLRRVGRAVCIVFSLAFVLCSLTMGSMLQSSAISEALNGTMHVPPVATGAVLAALTLYICMSGTQKIVKITNLLVPVMSIGYVLISLAVIIPNAHRLCDVLSLIVRSALSPTAAAGGVGGFAISRAVRYGVMRGLVSNEAGCGTAPCAHAIADCSSPAKQGVWGIFEVFVDTVVLCTLTALVVILEYDAASAYDGNYMLMTVAAFSARLGSAAAYFLCAAVLCFGFATVLCWAHYGLCAVRSLGLSPSWERPFIFVYALCVLLGTCTPTSLSWELCDLSMGIMCVINLIACVGLWRQVKRHTENL